MRKRAAAFMLAIAAALFFAGCGDAEKVTEQVGKEITEIKEDHDRLTELLDAGTASRQEEFTIAFPENAKEEYLKLLQTALKKVEFKAEAAESNGENGYRVKMNFKPLDMKAVLEAADIAYAENMQSADFQAELKNVVIQDISLLEDPVYKEETWEYVEVKKSGDKLEVSSEDMLILLQKALPGYMNSYNIIARAFDRQDFLKAYMDAMFKGEIDRYCEHTGMTDEEVMAWYEEAFEEIDGIGLSEEQNMRVEAALKTIMANCNYTVGIPRRESEYSYIVEVDVVPNLSLQKAMEELEGGTYYSEAQVKEEAVNIYEKYAAEPVYGDAVTTSVTVNIQELAGSMNEESQFMQFMRIILP